MASLQIRTSDGNERVLRLGRRLTTVGAAPENDLVLAGEGLPPTALHILFDGRDFEAACHGGAEMELNGKRRLAARLAEGDVIRLGGAELRVSMADHPAPPAARRVRVEAMEGLVRFSELLLGASDLFAVLDGLLDAVLDATHAERGFLLLYEEGQLRVKAARSLGRETLHEPFGLSDSIVARALADRRGVVVADALHDEAFSSSSSVIDLRLVSVMCAPLLRQGEPLGAIYLANDNVVSLFGDADLDVLTVYAAQASLLVQNALLLSALRRENLALRQVAEEQVARGQGTGPEAGLAPASAAAPGATAAAAFVLGVPPAHEPVKPLAEAKEEFQRRYIDEVLARNGGNRTKTAKDLGVDPRTIFRHLERSHPEKGGERRTATPPPLPGAGSEDSR